MAKNEELFEAKLRVIYTLHKKDIIISDIHQSHLFVNEFPPSPVNKLKTPLTN